MKIKKLLVLEAVLSFLIKKACKTSKLEVDLLVKEGTKKNNGKKEIKRKRKQEIQKEKKTERNKLLKKYEENYSFGLILFGL